VLHELDSILRRRDDLCADDFQKAASRLLARQFIYPDDRNDKGTYQLIVNHRNYYENLFQALGHRLTVDNDYAFIGLIPLYSWRKLKMVDSMMLLVARQVYDDEVREMNTDRGTVSVTVEDYFHRFEHLTGRERPVKESHLKEIIARLSHYGIIRYSSSAETGDEPVIHILPGIVALITVDSLQRMSEYNETTSDDSQGGLGGECDEEEESADETEEEGDSRGDK